MTLFGVLKRVVSKRVVSADVPPERKPERGVRSPKPPFYETALLSPSDAKLIASKSSFLKRFCCNHFGRNGALIDSSGGGFFSDSLLRKDCTRRYCAMLALSSILFPDGPLNSS